MMSSPSLRSHGRAIVGSAHWHATLLRSNPSGAAAAGYYSMKKSTNKQPACRAVVSPLPLQTRWGSGLSHHRRGCRLTFGNSGSFASPSSQSSPPLSTSTSRNHHFASRTSRTGQQQQQQQQQHTHFFSSSARTMADRYLRQTHDRVFESNRAWAAEQVARDPDFFKKLSEGQTPEYLWISCSDSRIPAEQIAGLSAGEAFVHRNIANLVPNTDLNVMSVIQYAVAHLHVKHIVVCGHYGCGGVKAAMTAQDLGILNPWLRGIRDVYRLHERELDAIADKGARYDRLVELNVVEQCRNVVKTAVVQKAFAENRFPVVHGWVFGFHDGLLKDLEIDFEAMLKDIQKIYNVTGN